ncbi:hypothetical protein [Nocardioides sp. zg-1228]|uniref:hypothetical protein n=1 Tax=Nocardioides sp. zg-1228 TaxID=2763008 RepID=UPI00164342F5|nr:hypothetical protein [Nocardioides sp. zg-1228]MBC2933710.1 hypothetical protein [Nocardioides sp. zg-1228]QSF58493.1 hypothetical protein JX575_04630 [Nocardioides sp. zg-1228]
MSIPSTLTSSACPTLPSPRRPSAVAPVRLLGAHVLWRLLWQAHRPALHVKTTTAPQVDLRGRLE